MKKFITAILIIAILGCLAACGKPYVLEKPSSLSVDYEETVAMILLADTVSSTGLSVSLVNESDKGLESGNLQDFYVEMQKNDGTWYTLVTKNEMVNSSETMYFSEDGTYELSFDWGSRYGELESGHYRLVKTFWFEDSYNVEVDIAVEFDL